MYTQFLTTLIIQFLWRKLNYAMFNKMYSLVSEIRKQRNSETAAVAGVVPARSRTRTGAGASYLALRVIW